MAVPVSGRVTGIAVDPSDPSRAGDLFRFNLDLLVDHAGDSSRLDDTFDFNLAGGKGDTSGIGWHADGFTGGVFVAGHAPELPLTETSQFEAGHDLSYNNSFTCIPEGVLF